MSSPFSANSAFSPIFTTIQKPKPPLVYDDILLALTPTCSKEQRYAIIQQVLEATKLFGLAAEDSCRWLSMKQVCQSAFTFCQTVLTHCQETVPSLLTIKKDTAKTIQSTLEKIQRVKDEITTLLSQQQDKLDADDYDGANKLEEQLHHEQEQLEKLQAELLCETMTFCCLVVNHTKYVACVEMLLAKEANGMELLTLLLATASVEADKYKANQNAVICEEILTEKEEKIRQELRTLSSDLCSCQAELQSCIEDQESLTKETEIEKKELEDQIGSLELGLEVCEDEIAALQKRLQSELAKREELTQSHKEVSQRLEELTKNTQRQQDKWQKNIQVHETNCKRLNESVKLAESSLNDTIEQLKALKEGEPECQTLLQRIKDDVEQEGTRSLWGQACEVAAEVRTELTNIRSALHVKIRNFLSGIEPMLNDFAVDNWNGKKHLVRTLKVFESDQTSISSLASLLMDLHAYYHEQLVTCRDLHDYSETDMLVLRARIENIQSEQLPSLKAAKQAAGQARNFRLAALRNQEIRTLEKKLEDLLNDAATKESGNQEKEKRLTLLQSGMEELESLLGEIWESVVTAENHAQSKLSTHLRIVDSLFHDHRENLIPKCISDKLPFTASDEAALTYQLPLSAVDALGFNKATSNETKIHTE